MAELFPSSLCNCTEKSSIHVHCPCSECNGKAVNRRTQLRHIHRQNTMENHEDEENGINESRFREELNLTLNQSLLPQDEFEGKPTHSMPIEKVNEV